MGTSVIQIVEVLIMCRGIVLFILSLYTRSDVRRYIGTLSES